MLYNNSAFYNHVRELRRALRNDDLTTDTRLIVDLSDGFHSIFSTGGDGLAKEYVLLNPSNQQAVASYVNKLADHVLEHYDSLNLISRRYIFVIEGPVSKVNAPSKKSTAVRNMNRGLRGVFLGLKTILPPNQCLGRAIGRPDWTITVSLADELRRRGYEVFGDREIESDHTIAQIALRDRRDYVVIGCDMDLLALTNNIRGMVSPQNRNRGVFLEKAAMLRLFGLSERQFFIAFAASNCTNVVPLVPDTKFASVCEFLDENPGAVSRYDFSGWEGSSVDAVGSFAIALRRLYNERTVRSPDLIKIPQITPRFMRTRPLWLEFCNEEFAGELRRPTLLNRLRAVISEDGSILKDEATVRKEQGMLILYFSM